MEARDQRAEMKRLLAKTGYPTVSLSLNVPGFPKSNTTVYSFFCLCLQELKYHLKANLIKIDESAFLPQNDPAGDFAVAQFPFENKSLAELKQICESFEMSHPLGRFIDVDLSDEMGNAISSGKSKLCFFCMEKTAIECRRSKKHDQKELRIYMFKEMSDYYHRKREKTIAKQLSSFGLKSLLYEISLSPKPGLVDKFNSGSHTDMNYRTFIDSTSSISGWFEVLVLAGFSFYDLDFTKALPIIRKIGLQMEDAMFESTGNVNTQKGIIFLIGLSLFACGKLYQENDHFDAENFQRIIRDICSGIVNNELNNSLLSECSHGEVVFRKYGFNGIRGEAESGLQTVFDFGLPQLSGVLELNDDLMIKCFLSIAANNADTNILFRKDNKVLMEFQERCRYALLNYNQENYFKVIDFCKNENISPGGSADLLCIAIFIWNVITADLKQKFNIIVCK